MSDAEYRASLVAILAGFAVVLLYIKIAREA